jgi:hypothetical protein
VLYYQTGSLRTCECPHSGNVFAARRGTRGLVTVFTRVRHWGQCPGPTPPDSHHQLPPLVSFPSGSSRLTSFVVTKCCDFCWCSFQEPGLRLSILRVPNLMSTFRCSGRFKRFVQFRDAALQPTRGSLLRRDDERTAPVLKSCVCAVTLSLCQNTFVALGKGSGSFSACPASFHLRFVYRRCQNLSNYMACNDGTVSE